MIWLKKHWRLILVGVEVLILLFWIGWIGSITGTNRKLYNMMLDQLRKDQTVVEDLRESLKINQAEKEKIKKDIVQVQKEKELWKQKSLQYEKENLQLKGEVDDLEFKLHQIIVSSAPDTLILDINKYLQQRGVGTIRKR